MDETARVDAAESKILFGSSVEGSSSSGRIQMGESSRSICASQVVVANSGAELACDWEKRY